MTAWADVEADAPGFATRVRGLFERRRHHTLATLRSDGSPRVSGIEVTFEGGDVVLGMMPGSRKLHDVERDPRLAVHCTSDDPPEGDPAAWAGDAKVTGRAVRVGIAGDPEAAHFRIDVAEVVLTRIDETADHLVIEAWHPGRGLRRIDRR